MDIMKSVKIGNNEAKNILNEFSSFWWDERDNLSEYYRLGCHSKPPKASDREGYISEEYKNKIISMGGHHDGYPEDAMSYEMREPKPHHLSKKVLELTGRLQTVVSTRYNALCCVYPPGGFIAWHNNANASSYNLILTWSEKGDGWFKYVDPRTNETVTVPDVPGWQAKAFFFGCYADGPENLVYHAASTDCWRMTVSYMFDRDHKEFWEDVIEELGMDD